MDELLLATKSRRDMLVKENCLRNHVMVNVQPFNRWVHETEPSDLRMQTAFVGTSAFATPEFTLREWSRLELAIAPIIGIRGFGAIYGRSLERSRRSFPWLPTAQGVKFGLTETTNLYDALAGQPAAEASSGAAMLNWTFADLLASLVGTRIADLLLAPSSVHRVRIEGHEEHPDE